MSGIFAQLGIVAEKMAVVPTISAGTSVAGTPNVSTLTVSSSTGIRVGDVVTIAGATPSTWNGDHTITSVVDATHIAFQTTGTALVVLSSTMPTFSKVTSWGVATTVSKFFEFVSESIKLSADRISSAALRVGNRYAGANRFTVNRKGVAGDIQFEVLSKGFGVWLEHMLGTIATTGPADTAAYTHTGTIGPLRGKGLTVQVGRPTNSQDALQPFTYNGMKVAAWELSCGVDGILMLKITLDGQNEVITVALATASYSSAAELLTFVGGTVQLAGVAVANITQITITGTHTLANARRFIAASSLKAEQLENGMHTVTMKATCEFADVTAYNKFASATAAGALSAIIATWTGPTLIAGAATTYPSLTVNLPNFRHDGDTPTVTGPGMVTFDMSGPALNSVVGTNDAVNMVYVTADTTP